MMYERFEKITEKEQAAAAKMDHTIQVCIAASCLSSQSDKVLDAVQSEINAGKHSGCQAKGVGCMGLCSRGPLVNVVHKDEALGETLYQDVTPGNAKA